MDRSELPATAFIDPNGDNAADVRQFAVEALELMLNHAGCAGDSPPLPDETLLNEHLSDLTVIPDGPLDDEAIIDAIQTALSGSMNAANPGYLGHMDSMPTTASVIGDLVAATLNNNLLSVEMSPFFSRLETDLVKSFVERFGLPDTGDGVLTSGGTLANLQALAIARNRTFDTHEQGLSTVDAEPVVLTSAEAHTSVQKAAMLLGLGTDAVVPIGTTANSRLDVGELERTLDQLHEVGSTPFCLIGTAGTTTTGAIDPLDEMATVAAKHDLWFHVDAAYGGALVFSPDEHHRLAGIERADSITFNPQKWLYVAKTCAMVLVRDGQLLDEEFRIGAPYMRDSDVANRGEFSVQGTRHADVCKLWFSLTHLGTSGYVHLIGEGYRLAERVVDAIEHREYLHLANDPDTNVVCFRAAPVDVPASAWDDLNRELQEFLLDEGFFLSLPVHRGERWLRAVLLNPYADADTIDGLFEAIDSFVESQRARR